MAKILVKHKITVKDFVDGTGTEILAFYAPPNAYPTDIATAAGVIAPGETTPNQFDNFPACSTEELLKTGSAVRKTLLVERNGKNYYHKIIVADNNAATFDAAAINKSYRGGTIKKVVNPLDAVFY